MPLTGGFHGVLRTPLNDREFEFPRPLLGVTLARPPPRPGTHLLSRTSFRGSVATEESPGWFRRGNDNGAEIMLSFSRFTRESHWWLLTGNDVVLLCPCVVAKYAQLRFRLAAKASPAPLLLLFGRDPLRWVRVRGEG